MKHDQVSVLKFTPKLLSNLTQVSVSMLTWIRSFMKSGPHDVSKLTPTTLMATCVKHGLGFCLKVDTMTIVKCGKFMKHGLGMYL